MLPFLKNKNKQNQGATVVTKVSASSFSKDDKKKPKKAESKSKKSKEKPSKADRSSLFKVEGQSDTVQKLQVKLNLPKNVK